jgi:hypothetical protein
MGCGNCGNNDCKDSCARVVITKQGERGPAGNPGIQGERGFTGNQGTQGANGSNGTNATLPYNALCVGLITQSIAADPTVVTPTGGNTIGAIAWTRNSAGTYRGTLIGGFVGDILCFITQAPKISSSKVPSFIQMGKMTDDYVEIRVYDFDGVTLSDSRLEDASFKIERWT